MNSILLVDDDQIIINTIENKLYDCINDIEIISKSNYAQTQAAVDEFQFKIAIVDLTLSDAPNGEIIDLLATKGIPTIALTQKMDDMTRSVIINKEIVDFVSKNDLDNISFLAKIIKRILNNYSTKVLVVTDSPEHKQRTTTYLRKLNLTIYHAENGQEALDLVLQGQNSISLVLTDFKMPVMDGLELTIRLREHYNKDQLCIIALSSNEDPTLSTKFLKRGANDYLKKPFSEDEIQIRVNTNLEMFHLLRNASDLANRDYLTNAYNRRYFFESGNAILKKAIRNKKSLFLAILDIDHFKQINDTFGHDIGDEALKYFSKKLNESFRTSDLIARFGGEEFCVLLEDISQEKAIELLDNFRKYFENHTLNAGPHEIHFTISIGIFYGLLDDLGDMIKEADMGLYRAKESGRNKIILNDESIV